MNGRGLVVLADGAQAAFCAGVIGELSRRGWRWVEGAGAGLGAWLALLGLVGEGEEAERRFLRLGERGIELLSSPLDRAQEQLASSDVLVLPDAMRLTGWLRGEVLAEHLAADLVLIGQAPVWIAWENLQLGQRCWRKLEEASHLLAAAAFPWGWPPDETGSWGGVDVCCELPWPPLTAEGVDVICGFPVPSVERPGFGNSLFFFAQRRAEIAAAATVTRWLQGPGEIKLWAPSEESYKTFSQRPLAQLGVEYPYPVEQNAELCQTMLNYGRWLARKMAEPR